VGPDLIRWQKVNEMIEVLIEASETMISRHYSVCLCVLILLDKFSNKHVGIVHSRLYHLPREYEVRRAGARYKKSMAYRVISAHLAWKHMKTKQMQFRRNSYSFT
jgi:hypothetical protein